MEEEKKYAESDPTLLNSLGINLKCFEIPAELKSVIHAFILPLFKTRPSLYLFYTSWLIIDPLKNCLMGDLAFKGWPSTSGRVEVGYGLFDEYHNKGIMSEALKMICNWAAKEILVKEIIAETLCTNSASKRVLEKNLFTEFTSNENYNYWIKIFNDKSGKLD